MKISVALCTYNGEKFLKKQIDSILSQTIKVDEIVVCDDRSQDGTLRILNGYQSQYPDVFRVFINDENLRSVKNFEKAISKCTGDLIFLSDQDDIWIPEKVEIFIDHFDKNPELSVLASNGFVINDQDEVLDVLTIWDVVTFLRKENSPLNYYEIINISGNIATGATMAIKREFIGKTLPFPSIPGFHHDEWIALVASLEHQFDFLDVKTIYYRKHDAQQVGGIFYENTPKRKKSLIDFFTPDFDERSFKNYKFLLKRVSNTYHKNKNLYDSAMVKKEFFRDNLEYFRTLFFKLKKEMKDKYPVKTYFLDIADRINKKRQLD